MAAMWVEDVHNFWFGEVGPQAWFATDKALDNLCRSRFLQIHAAAMAEFNLADAIKSPERALANVILFDQFPRNMFRGTARAFASDPLALAIAREAVRQKLDVDLGNEQRLFLYLPFEHSESLADQELSVELFRQLGNDEWVTFALAHRDIIARFGRFPHRNAVLRRASTPEELAFLEKGRGF
jgi:uncharacterized protein (DUF924 family)